jgi:hypothetical protein
MLRLLVAASIAALSLQAKPQLPSAPEASAASPDRAASAQPLQAYVRPSTATKTANYVSNVIGPYPIAITAITAGIDQYDNAPPEWTLDFPGYGKRFGSDFAISAVGTTTRYGLAAVFKEDTLYYRCECSGPFPRLRHAAISTLMGRRGLDGHRIFSLSALAAPYAGSAAAVYGWYPSRYGAKDVFRMGNYTLLEFMGANIALEFFYIAPRSMVKRMHLSAPPGSPVQKPAHE